jgi:indole-3-glycerol phosphate synthase
VSIPVLRKDFIIDPYQIYESKVLGASAILLICALLDTRTLSKYLSICHELGLSALVEAHNEAEVESALETNVRIIGINNRNLNNFSVDISNSIRLRDMVPDNIVFVSESGIKTPEDVEMMRKAKVDGVLIGETLMRSLDKKHMLEYLRGNSYDKN